MESDLLLDVAIIGGGWSGILASKYMKVNGLKYLTFEGTDSIGGVYKYREDVKDVGGVIKSTHTTSSKTTLDASDFPMPHHWSHFPSHEQIIEYLNSYIDHFEIRDKILLNTKILSAKKEGDLWLLKDQHGKVYKSKNLIVSSGVHQFPDRDYLKDPRFKEASVEMMHACSYKLVTPEFHDKRVLIYGGGETASDISSELCHVAKRVIMSVPHGVWLVNRYSRVAEHMDEPFVLDSFSSRFRRLLDPTVKGVFSQVVIERECGKNGHGIKVWESKAPYFRQFLNKSGQIVHYIALGSLIPKGDVLKVTGKEVTFTDGSKEEIDLIVFCNGYKTKFPFLEEKYHTPINQKFKFCFENEDPSLAFIGFVRPVVGSIPVLSELQSLYAGKIFSHKLKMPDFEQRQKIMQKDLEYQRDRFVFTSQRIAGLVDGGVYSDQMAILAGIYPNYFKLFLKSPRKWWIAYHAPYNNCQFLLNDPKYQDQIFETFNHRIQPNLRKVLFDFGVIGLCSLIPSLVIRSRRSPFLLKLASYIKNFIVALVWVLISPVILYRVIKQKRARSQIK